MPLFSVIWYRGLISYFAFVYFRILFGSCLWQRWTNDIKEFFKFLSFLTPPNIKSLTINNEFISSSCRNFKSIMSRRWFACVKRVTRRTCWKMLALKCVISHTKMEHFHRLILLTNGSKCWDKSEWLTHLAPSVSDFFNIFLHLLDITKILKHVSRFIAWLASAERPCL